MPIAATSHNVAAVVSPRTERPCRMIAPAPRKPIPLTICAAMRVGSMRVPVAVKKSSNPYADEREQGRADADDEMRAQTRLTLAKLPLETDRAAEAGGDDETQEDV